MRLQIYMPSYMVVVLAWVSFWVDREQTTARIAMGITTVLTMATLIGSARVSLPQVSYVKSLEWFLIMCFMFVFFAILEYALVSYLVFKMRIEERERGAQSFMQVRIIYIKYHLSRIHGIELHPGTHIMYINLICHAFQVIGIELHSGTHIMYINLSVTHSKLLV